MYIKRYKASIMFTENPYKFYFPKMFLSPTIKPSPPEEDWELL